MKIKHGAYAGDGTTPRAITGIGFAPDVVIVRNRQASYNSEIRFAGQSTAGSLDMSTNSNRVQGILSLDADGFTLGNDGSVNAAGNSFLYLAIQADAGELCAVGSYTGNGVAGNAIAVGLAPDFVLIRADGQPTGMAAAWTVSAAAANVTKDCGAVADYANGITALTATGFTLGTNAKVNYSGRKYLYLAIKNTPGGIACGTYTGDGLDNRNLSGLGFQPDGVLTKGTDAQHSCWRTSGEPGDLTTGWSYVNESPNLLQALQADGFQLGSGTRANQSGIGYHWWAVKDGTWPVPGTTEKSASDAGTGTEAPAGTVGGGLSLDSGTAADAAVSVISGENPIPTPEAGTSEAEGAGDWQETWMERPIYDATTGHWHYQRVPMWEWYPGVQVTLEGPTETGTAGDAASVVEQLVVPAPDAGVSADALTGPPEVSFELEEAGAPAETAGPYYEVSLSDGNAISAQDSLAFEIIPLAVGDAGAPAAEAFGSVALTPDAPERAAGTDTTPNVDATLPTRSDGAAGAEAASKLALLDRHILSCEIDSSLEALADGATLEMVETDPANPTSPVAQAWLRLNRGDLVRIRLGLAGIGFDDYGIFRVDDVNLSTANHALRSTLSARDRAALLLDEQGNWYSASFGAQPTSSTAQTPTVYPSVDAAVRQTQESYPDMAGIASALAGRVGLGLIWDAPSYTLKDFTIGPEESTGAALGRLLEPLRVTRRYRADAWVSGENLVVRERGGGPITGILDCRLGQVQSIRRSQLPFVGDVSVTGATVVQRIEYRSDGEKKPADTPDAAVEVSEEPDGDKVVKTYISKAVDEYSWTAIKELTSVETTHQEYEDVPTDDDRWLGRVLVYESVQLDYDLHTGQPKHELREVRYSYDSEHRLILMTQLRKTFESPTWKLVEMRTTHSYQATPTDVRTSVCEWVLKESDGELHMRAGYPKSQVSPGTLQSGLQLVPNPDNAWDQEENGSTPRQTRTFEITKQYEGSSFGGGSLPRSYSNAALVSDSACNSIAVRIASESGAWLYEVGMRWPRPLPYRKGDRVTLVHLPGGMPDGDALITRMRTRFDHERSEWIHDLTLEAWRAA